MSAPGSIMWGRFTLMLIGLTGLGWGIMRATTPTEEEFYNQLSPELKKRVDEVRAARNPTAGIKEQLASAQSGEKDQIVWADTLGNSSGRKV